MAGEAGEAAARARAGAVLRLRGSALAVALLPAAAAVVLHAGRATGRIDGPAWDGVRWGLTGVALLVLAVAAAVAAVIVRAEPAVSPTVPVAESAAPDLYLMVRDLADRLQVPPPSSIELTPDCDSWLEDRRHKAGGTDAERRPGPVLVVGSPFMWWMRIAELRALLAPVVAGTAPSADPEISAARRFVRGLDAAAAVAAQGSARPGGRGVLGRPVYAFLGWVARLLLRACRVHAAEMERGVAASASERAQAVDYGLRIVAQEQVGLAYAGWDRLLTRVALPAWRIGRWPSRLHAGVVAALTELSRRDRLADGFETRLGERPACDLLEEPGTVDEAVSLLAARIFHGGPDRARPGWEPVGWARYPAEVVDRLWREEAGRLIRVIEEMRPSVEPAAAVSSPAAAGRALLVGGEGEAPFGAVTLERVIDRLAVAGGQQGEEVAARLEAAPPLGPYADAAAAYPLVPQRTGRELLVDHVVALVCCAAVDTAGAGAGLDWLDGPALRMPGVRRSELTAAVLHLVESGDPAPLRAWVGGTPIRPDKPLRLP
ncbi:hypothetical protein OG896_21325 [Streptomyces sp. NBC_00669]|uniref:hypothetical protein n=1 Tax=Streptomyces sp. NBC_00669 TaxID=2976011 RepID=UPI002E33CC4C|nr:hypothetical protein [Streptomyces sp. NBC_00669]